MPLFHSDRFFIGVVKFWQKLKSQPEMVSAAELWRGARAILICFPDEYQARQAAEPAVRSIVEAYPHKRFYVLTERALPERWLNVELVHLRKGDLNLFSMPSREFIRYIQYKRIDVAIDLWPSFHLTNACLCRRCGAILRVSFDSPHASTFFNMLIVPEGPQEPLGKRYEVMMETILNLQRSEAEIAG